MSDFLKIALVAEGPTDKIFLESVLEAVLKADKKSFDLKMIQPEYSEAFKKFGPIGTGWGGVYKWCRQAVERSGSVSKDVLFESYDFLIVHIDADVAGKNYKDANILIQNNDLPCEKRCPPPQKTTDALRVVIQKWMNERSLNTNIILCVPSKSIETWVIKALFPDDVEVRKKNWECFRNPESRLGQQLLKNRIKKTTRDYEKSKGIFSEMWSMVSRDLKEAKRFENELTKTILNA